MLQPAHQPLPIHFRADAVKTGNPPLLIPPDLVTADAVRFFKQFAAEIQRRRTRNVAFPVAFCTGRFHILCRQDRLIPKLYFAYRFLEFRSGALAFVTDCAAKFLDVVIDVRMCPVGLLGTFQGLLLNPEVARDAAINPV